MERGMKFGYARVHGAASDRRKHRDPAIWAAASSRVRGGRSDHRTPALPPRDRRYTG